MEPPPKKHRKRSRFKRIRSIGWVLLLLLVFIAAVALMIYGISQL